MAVVIDYHWGNTSCLPLSTVNSNYVPPPLSCWNYCVAGLANGMSNRISQVSNVPRCTMGFDSCTCSFYETPPGGLNPVNHRSTSPGCLLGWEGMSAISNLENLSLPTDSCRCSILGGKRQGEPSGNPQTSCAPGHTGTRREPSAPPHSCGWDIL